MYFYRKRNTLLLLTKVIKQLGILVKSAQNFVPVEGHRDNQRGDRDLNVAVALKERTVCQPEHIQNDAKMLF